MPHEGGGWRVPPPCWLKSFPTEEEGALLPPLPPLTRENLRVAGLDSPTRNLRRYWTRRRFEEWVRAIPDPTAAAAAATPATAPRYWSVATGSAVTPVCTPARSVANTCPVNIHKEHGRSSPSPVQTSCNASIISDLKPSDLPTPLRKNRDHSRWLRKKAKLIEDNHQSMSVGNFEKLSNFSADSRIKYIKEELDRGIKIDEDLWSAFVGRHFGTLSSAGLQESTSSEISQSGRPGRYLNPDMDFECFHFQSNHSQRHKKERHR